jgi:hypothetical protein
LLLDLECVRGIRGDSLNCRGNGDRVCFSAGGFLSTYLYGDGADEQTSAMDVAYVWHRRARR